MKWVMTVGAVLAIPALAFGAASFTLTAGGTGVNGTTSITVCKLTAPAFSIDLGIVQDDTLGASLFGGALAASANDTFYVTGRSFNINNRQLATTTKVWINADNKWLETDAHPGQNFGVMHDTYYWMASTFPRVMETMNLQVSATAPNATYIISISNPNGGIYIGDHTAEAHQLPLDSSATVEVTVIPEPASMLLLAGLLPFLRRRRSA